MSSIKQIALFAVISSYLLFPIFSGAWFESRIECVWPWSEAIKQGLSCFAYFALGMFSWKLIRTDAVSHNGALAGYFSAAFLGFSAAANVISKCL